MTTGPHTTPELTEAGLVELYGDAPVTLGTFTVPLTQALAMEAAFCPADSETRTDPDRRLAYLAGMLASAGSLLPEHQHLLPPPVTPS
ncbi:MAG TPA: hypothetical protein VLH86_03200 [Patescibacteria group bacterium]|nr:hypothetical protein [Patescibacteria group bacterium]